MARRVISAVLELKDQSFQTGMKRAGRNLSDFDRQSMRVGNAVQNMSKKAVGAFKTMGTAVAGLAAGGIAALGAGVTKTMMDMDSAFATLQAQTGATGDGLKELGGAAKDAFAKGYGESLTDVSSAVARVRQNFKNLDNGEVGKVTQNALLLSKTFDSDVNEVTRGVNNAMEAFGISSEKAFDLFTAGGQRGLNFSNEMFDNVAEYSSLFGAMGYSAEEYFGIMERGAKSGVYNLDYVNDVMKEFQIRIKDNSDKTSDYMGLMSQSTLDLWEAQYQGKATVAEVASSVVKDLQSMDNQVDANEAGVALFGTKWEDLESKAMYAMLGSTEAMKDFEGATQTAADAVENSIGNRLKSSWRDLQLTIADVTNESGAQEFFDSVANKADELVPKVVNVVEKAIELGNTIKTHWVPIRETVIGITVAVAAFSLTIKTLTIIKTVTTFMSGFTTVTGLAKVAMHGLNTAMRANPIGVVATVVGLLTAGIVLLYRNSEKFRGIWDSVWGSVKRAASTAVNGVIDAINKMIGAINRIPGVNIPIIPKVQWGNVTAGAKEVYSASSGKGPQMASFDVGSNRISRDQVAQIHAGEMIIPARQAEKVRQAGGNINNIDRMVSSPSTTIKGTSGTTFGDIIIHAKGVTSTEVVNEIVPKLKLALSNM
ncbi:MAG: phage tail tape measure protein [Niallia sp.]